MNLPNQITLGRFVLAVASLCTLAGFEFTRRTQTLWALDTAFVLFVIAAGTDWLDGYLARKQNQVTSFGRILDPFVDKILLLGSLVILLGQGFRNTRGETVTDLQAWMVVIIIARELLVSGLRGFSEGQGRAYAANWWGKTKMFVQCIAVGWLMLSVGRLHHVEWVTTGRPIVVWIMVLYTAASVIAYLFASREALAEQSRD
jgi:CDP-diacylglycerol--glycerol-3-phosphate 3-phosphatidyltransferase